jgi:hypothetical protein
MYKFVIPDIERNKNIFLMFLKYRSNYHYFNNLVIISKKDACKAWLLNPARRVDLRPGVWTLRIKYTKKGGSL